MLEGHADLSSPSSQPSNSDAGNAPGRPSSRITTAAVVYRSNDSLGKPFDMLITMGGLSWSLPNLRMQAMVAITNQGMNSVDTNTLINAPRERTNSMFWVVMSMCLSLPNIAESILSPGSPGIGSINNQAIVLKDKPAKPIGWIH